MLPEARKVDADSKDRYHHIKQEYSAAQPLEYYRQGPDLQECLIELYQSRKSEK